MFSFSFSAFSQELLPDLAVDSIIFKDWGILNAANLVVVPRPGYLPPPAPPIVPTQIFCQAGLVQIGTQDVLCSGLSADEQAYYCPTGGIAKIPNCVAPVELICPAQAPQNGLKTVSCETLPLSEQAYYCPLGGQALIPNCQAPGLIWPTSGVYWFTIRVYIRGDGYYATPYYLVYFWAMQSNGILFSTKFQCMSSNGVSFQAGSYSGNSVSPGTTAQCLALNDVIYGLSGLSGPYGAPYYGNTQLNGFIVSSSGSASGEGNLNYPIGDYGFTSYSGRFGENASSATFYGAPSASFLRQDQPTGDLATRVIEDYKIMSNGVL